ncbi:uncharacterized protein L3040_003799 [Drepanopeziza brunnea f. sp. 'multigermtubi']|nr:hypothetical protein L3040_003799 [Drepanopeziza brunnea f. sp. 'multigermtubi']
MNTITRRGLRTASLYQRLDPTLCHLSKPQSILSNSSRPITHSRRHASYKSSKPTKLSSPSTPSTPQTQANSKLLPINGPLSTLPAPLTLPTRSPDQSLPAHLFALGKSYLSFYKTGVKNIYANHRACKPLYALLAAKHASSIPAAVRAHALSRSDFQLLCREKHDLRRVPLFALVLLVCGEFTPLVVLAITGIVPWTCRIPKQIDSDRQKLEERRRTSFRNLTHRMPVEKRGEAVTMNRMQLLHISWSLGLSSSAWDFLGGKLPGLPTGVLRRKWVRRREYLDTDDMLLRRGGRAALKELSVEELRMACVDRGVDVLGRPEEDLRRDLEAWLKCAERLSMERLVLTRPSVWPKYNK